MTASGLSRPFVNVADIGNTTLYREYHHLVTSSHPIEGIWYPSSFLQAEGWFRKPNGGKDGLQHVFCWSLSDYKGTEHESFTLATNGYIFYTLGPDRRAMWREVKPLTTYSSSLADVALHPSIQLNWFGSSSLGSNVIWPTQPPVPALPNYAHRPPDSVIQGIADVYVGSADTSFSSEPTPSSQLPDTSSDASVDVYSLGDSDSEQFKGPRPYFYIDAQGNITLDVPRSLKDRDAVKMFLEKALAELSKSVRMVKCSLCRNNKAKKDWHVKPSNLERHILAHLRIKDHHCTGCKEEFTTKDQMTKHIKKKHPAMTEPMKIIDQDGGNCPTTNEDMAQGTHASSSSAAMGPPVEEAEPWLNDQTDYALPAPFMVPLNNNHSFF
ncbi:hypothetical protein V565_021050 [Rhizoctonia solani 123E]|uniref:C2H2-type domain-containing protein n=1 Tax=Rhizoctonia solani 123E TaxID=1423351 RepID=A0A074S469_9AGAM|nr:hypothetical protein V565_021050 [Rhizoctonia solani 123E]